MAASPGIRVFVTGATGLLGRQLCSELGALGHGVVALTRISPPPDAPPSVRWVRGDVARGGAWCEAVDGCDAVVHLAGEPIAGGRWSRARRARLVASRVDGARRLAEAIARARRPPQVLVSASACGYYGPAGERELDESAPAGNDFLAHLCVDWEAAAAAARSHAVRVVLLRFGVVLSRAGGALARMLPAFRLGLGGPLGPGERFFPWLHEADALGLLLFALGRAQGCAGPSGPINAVAPQAVRMREFAFALGRALQRPARLPLPLPLLRLALGQAAEGLVPGQRVVPRRALEEGYCFRQPELVPALSALL